VVSKIGRFTRPDPTPKCFFRNAVLQPKFAPKQVLNVKDFCEDWLETPFSDEEKEFTNALRSNSRTLGRMFHNWATLTGGEMRSFVDLPSLLLPKDNKLGLDYLTYRHPVYKTFITRFCDELLKLNSEYEDAVRILLIDYSANAPYASMMRNDDRMAIVENAWPKEARFHFSKRLNRLFEKSFRYASSRLEDFAPPINSTKSLGFFDSWLDGTVYNVRRDGIYLPSNLNTAGVNPLENLWTRKSNLSVRRAWLDSGTMLSKFDFFLEHLDWYHDPNHFVDCITNQAASVHKEAYRLNNGDPALNDLTHGVEHAIKEGLYKKDRDIAFEIAPMICGSGRLRDKQYEDAFRTANPDCWGTLLKKRPMFPGPNLTFSVPFQLLVRMILKPIEDLCCGMPCSSPKFIKRTQTFCQKHSNDGLAVIQFDRRTSEQFITDNIKLILSLLGDKLANIISAMLRSVVRSKYGPRVILGLLSGTAFTTFLNCICNLFEMCVCLASAAYGAKWNEHILAVVDVIFDMFEEALTNEIGGIEEFDYEVYLNGFSFCVSLGTDDQDCYVSKPRISDEDLVQLLNKNLTAAGFAKDKFLTCDVNIAAKTDKAFGLLWTRDGVQPSSALVVRKLFLFEKDSLGDKIATKYDCRLQLVPHEVYEVLARVQHDILGGDLSSYHAGSVNYFKNLGSFGIKTLLEDFNQYSPTENFLISEALNKILQRGDCGSTNPVFALGKWTDKQMRPFANKWSQYLFD